MFTLRPLQCVFKQAVAAAFASGARAVLGVMATGGGKSVIAADMAAGAVAKGRRVLVVSHRRQIVYQLHDHCSRNGIDSGIVMGDNEPNPEAPLQVASIQTLQRRGFAIVGQPDFVIVDEAHQFYAMVQKMIREVWPSTHFVGFTATPVGPGGCRIEHFEKMVEPVKNSELIAASHLLRVHPYLAPSEPDLGGINLKTVSQDELGQRVEACTVHGMVFDEWEPYRHMQTMVLLPSRAVCNQFHKIALSRGIKAEIVDGTTAQEDRENIFHDFQSTDCEMLLGIDVISEGLDLPVAQCLIDLHPTHQLRRWWQGVGRVKRPHPGQESAVVIDLAGNLWRHMVHPDQDPPWEEVTNDRTIEEVVERKAGVRCPKCGSKDVYGPIEGMYKCEDCGETWYTKKPWVCPHCRQALGPNQKVVGGICPNCAQKVGAKQLRRIRFADGTIRAVPADEIKRRKKCKANASQACWDKWRHIAHHTHRPLSFAGAMYAKETGHWPSGLKNCPEPGSADWKRKPAEAYPWMKKRTVLSH